MSSSTSNTSLARSRSLRIPASTTVKQPLYTHQPSTGPSNITLFLTNLRLLDLDLRSDWPGITALTFSTKDAQQNQKKRIQCVEWALYQLFALWDPEETRNKLQPFFPPLEPLQSLNLRAALFRCLDQAKKSGVLGRDTVLRKTMLDECKGERLDEVLAVFSNAVLKRALQYGGPTYEPLAQQLALENFSYTGERTILSALIMTHRASLRKYLQGKEEARAKYHDFSDLLNLTDRRIARRHEQLKQAIEENGLHGSIGRNDVYGLQDQVQRNWSGSRDWLDSILYGDSRANGEGLLATRFDKIWKHVEDGSIGEIEGVNRIGLLEQLDARVKDQENRLAKWQDFSKTLSKAADPSPLKETSTVAGEQGKIEKGKIDLGFTQHQVLQIGRPNLAKGLQTNSVTLEEYHRLIENMRTELAEVGKPQASSTRPAPQFLGREIRRSSSIAPAISPQEIPNEDEDEGWSSASDMDKASPESISYATKSTSRTPPSEPPSIVAQPNHEFPKASSIKPPVPKFSADSTAEVIYRPVPTPTVSQRKRSPSPKSRPRTPPPIEAPKVNQCTETENDLADQILNSVSASSPSPKKPRHTLSLAERTRLSMSRASHSQYSDLHDDIEIPDLARLSIKRRPTLAPKTPSSESEPGVHADLIERTRKSMAGFEAAQKKAQLERRKSVKDAKKKQRESSYFPKVEEESLTPDISAVELLEGDPDYESVFKSRPKIKTSPAVSPSRLWEENGD